MLQTSIPPGEQFSVQLTLAILFPGDIAQQINALSVYIADIIEKCSGDNEGTLCDLLPPGRCNFDGRCVSFCNTPLCLGEAFISGDTVRRVVKSVQEERCKGQGGDFDEDNVCQVQDNCDAIANQDQIDSDGDGTGDACECSELARQDQDTDGIEDCVDACLLPTSTFGPFVPNIGAPMCGCQPVALVGRGQVPSGQSQGRLWNGGAGIAGVPHLDALRCNFSADSLPTDGPFLLRDVTRQAASALLAGHLHGGALSSNLISVMGFPSGFSAVLSQEMVTKINTGGAGNSQIVTSLTMEGYSQSSSRMNQAAVDAQIGAQLFYDFLRTIRAPSGAPLISISDPSPGPLASMVSVVNEPPVDDPDRTIAAFFMPQGIDSFVGYPPTSTGVFASVALDIVGHEWFHAFSSMTAIRVRPPGVGLCSSGLCNTKAGVVEEAFADAVGVAFEMLAASEGRIPGKPTATFEQGEDIGLPNTRDIANPTIAHVRDSDFLGLCRPDTPTTGGGDLDTGGGIQRDCNGPFEKAFALLAVGGSFPSLAEQMAQGYTAQTVTVAGIGLRNAVRIAFAANQTQWQSDRNYAHYTRGVVQAAAMIFGAGSSQAQSTTNAFNAVGLLDVGVPIGVTIVPAGAGTVSPLPASFLAGSRVRIEAQPANPTRTFREFIVRVNGVASQPIRDNPTNIVALPGTTVEARFN